ncbi:IclR family pca regulon transcriptional regulator [Scopulibacillus daqui]|uniref:IclR family pca regulon transcriptional regulator n=1 Tax=Scopulibacillus daqui TaxID=1469162 RepID=A0ABS2PXU9_9BACL|nr:IclR family transcriptional regulator [Scopulibacillus daqui]MBM7644881.1 IclR family pca regulon transcriptional regulator [Scopulibacillus daqui]
MDIDQKDQKDRYLSNSLVRGLEILRLFNEKRQTLSLAEISSYLGVGRTTPYRILYTLQSMGYLHQDEQTKRYQLTPKVMELGFAYLNSLQLPEIAQHYLKELRDVTGASVHLGVMDGPEVVYIERLQGKMTTTVNISVGTRLPSFATTLGKVILAYQPEEEINKVLSPEYMEKVNTDPGMIFKIKEELKTIQKNGYSLSTGGYEAGINSVAAPIFNSKDKPIASVNIAAPDSALKDEFLNRVCIPKICEIANKISTIANNRLSV